MADNGQCFSGHSCGICGSLILELGYHTDWGYVHSECYHVVPGDP
jgi:hypothetical protein